MSPRGPDSVSPCLGSSLLPRRACGWILIWMRLGECASQLADQATREWSPLGPGAAGWAGEGFPPPRGAGLIAELRKADSVISIAATQHRWGHPRGRSHRQPGVTDVSVSLLIWGPRLPVCQAVTPSGEWSRSWLRGPDAESGDSEVPLAG